MATTRATTFSRLPEEQTLLDCVRSNHDIDRVRAGLGRPGFDWDAFWELAGIQHVQPLVARVLSDRTFGDVLPAKALGQIKAVRLQTAGTNLALSAELASIMTLLSRHGIDGVPLKGTRLAQRLFGAIDARRCGDIDLLVPEADWEAAYALLCQAGYAQATMVKPGVQRHPFHDVPLVRIANGRGYSVELHHKLSDPRFVEIDYQRLWRVVRERKNGSQQSLELPTADLLVYLAVHAPKHDSGLLRLLADIDHLITQEAEALDWSDIIQIARAWHADTILYFMLTLATALLDTPVPDHAIRQLQPPRWRRAFVPLLAGPATVLRPPVPTNLRANRFRLAYCLMLRHSGREIRSYWHYIVMPPQASDGRTTARIAQAARRPFDGMAWTTLAIGSAIWDRFRVRTLVHSG